MLVTFVKSVILEIVFKDEQSYKNPSLITVIFEKADKSTDSKEVHSERKLSPMLVTFVKSVILEIVFKDEHSRKKLYLISVIFEKADKSTDSKEVHSERKLSPMLVTFVKSVILEIVFKDEQPFKKRSLISVIFENADKSTDSKEVHPKVHPERKESSRK
eukprot:TRINITY_DN1115_c0_g2_i3.p1 TRINITY_DN1115_c0_g2~~TRINITY_DN1115_c0_g2_i3.p1  ORF type:complete len:160 (-),score=26.87 TRINITY_DN1115_c0_g2_i3:265-744(-)